MTDNNDATGTSRLKLTSEQKQTLAAALNTTVGDTLFDGSSAWDRTHVTITITDFALPDPSHPDTPEYAVEFTAQLEQEIADALRDTPILAAQNATVSAELWDAADSSYR